MKKDIYVIKNKINDKVYVGQSKNVFSRFEAHCKKSSQADSILSKAIQKYGKENFYFEILEHDVENYNERERFWIDYLNSTVPNGYNILPGGESPPVHWGVDSPNASIKNQETVQRVKTLLKKTRLSLKAIAVLCEIPKYTVSRINRGYSYFSDSERYPLRKRPNKNGVLTITQVKQIVNMLRNTLAQYETIGEQFGVSASTIRKINYGEIHHFDSENYPIREFKNSGTISLTKEKNIQISKLLIESKMSIREIARVQGVNRSTVTLVNSGKSPKYILPHLTYPLRKTRS